MSEQPNFSVVGNLSEKQLAQFNELKQTAVQLVNQIGALEVKKARLLADVDANEEKAQNLLKLIKMQFDLSEDSPFQILEDGRIVTPIKA
jgi:hypothetical protein